mgnify:CR=1 FL=1
MNTEKMTVRQFFSRFPNDDVCLEHIMEVRFGLRHDCQKCGVEATFHKLANRKAYSCSQCGAHLHPCAGTIFQDSRTPLTIWFYAIYMFVTTRHGVSGKELERQLGVTYKTAYRMGQQIRKLMGKADSIPTMQGHIEMDEAYIGGKRSGGRRGRGAPGKTILFGIKERGGNIAVEVVPNVRMETLRAVTSDKVSPWSVVSTDQYSGYKLLKNDGYVHGTVDHSKKQYARYDAELDAVHHVNNVESFWRLFKKSIASTHIHVSAKHMQKYVDEFTFRSNHRRMRNAMFDLLIGAL